MNNFFYSSCLKSDGKISPFCENKEDVATTLLMVQNAIQLFEEVWYQPMHWQHDPTDEEIAYEDRIIERSAEANKEIKRLAGEIYYSLTGERVQNVTSE